MKIQVVMIPEVGDEVEIVGGKAHHGYRIGDRFTVSKVSKQSVFNNGEFGIPMNHVRIHGVEQKRNEMREEGFIFMDDEKYKIVVHTCQKCNRPIDPNINRYYGYEGTDLHFSCKES